MGADTEVTMVASAAVVMVATEAVVTAPVARPGIERKPSELVPTKRVAIKSSQTAFKIVSKTFDSTGSLEHDCSMPTAGIRHAGKWLSACTYIFFIACIFLNF